MNAPKDLFIKYEIKNRLGYHYINDHHALPNVILRLLWDFNLPVRNHIYFIINEYLEN
jgi:hypothetical protein